MRHVGILGGGMYLPPEVRTNAWWPAATVERWMQRRPPPPAAPADASPGVRRVLDAMRAQAADPFSGAVERRVMPPSMSHLDMEEHAARAAIERAAIDPTTIDLVLVQTLAPEYLGSNLACVLHHRLGLSASCFALQTDAAQHTFLSQLAIAEGLILAGRATTALLVQSASASRLIDPEDPISPLFGDGATAMIVGEVGADRGLLGMAHRVDGRYPQSLIAAVRGGTWYDEGRVHVHIGDPAHMQDVFLATADVCKVGVDAALAAAGVAPADVDVFCIHQGTPWLRRVVQEHAGLGHARTLDTFPRTAHLHGALLPSQLIAAEAEHQLRDGDLVVLVGGGTGMTYGGAVLRWGRG